MKVIILLISLNIAFCIIGCDLDVNTSDLQASQSISLSKKHHFFISDCQLDSSSITIFKIKEVWLENKWKYKLNFGIAEREKTGGYQLNLALDSFVNPNFQSNNYTIKWDMKNSSDEYLGAQGNLFTLFLKGQNIPDTFYINIVQIDENRVRRYYNCFKIKRIN